MLLTYERTKPKCVRLGNHLLGFFLERSVGRAVSYLTVGDFDFPM